MARLEGWWWSSDVAPLEFVGGVDCSVVGGVDSTVVNGSVFDDAEDDDGGDCSEGRDDGDNEGGRDDGDNDGGKDNVDIVDNDIVDDILDSVDISCSITIGDFTGSFGSRNVGVNGTQTCEPYSRRNEGV